MACFLVPVVEAVVTTVISKAVSFHEAKTAENGKVKVSDESKIPLSKKIGRLSGFLWGGSGLLAFEHLWHGEISPVFPFLTAANDPQQMAEVFHEMATAGTSMAVLVTAFWAVITFAADKIMKRPTAVRAKEGSL
ncbi:MAG: hypothetical protein Q4E74_03855 [Ruminococcus sp.]|nr:hypothetical protein [Ruminococcus sp.]